MKKYILTIALLILIEGFASGTKICMAETGNNSINLSYRLSAAKVRNDINLYDYSNQVAIEYEYLLKGSKISLFGRFSTADYKKEETVDVGEDGTIRGCDLGMRFYPKGRKRMEKIFVGGSLGLLRKDWKDINLGFEQGPSQSEYIKKIDTEIGYRFNIGSKRISVTPSAYLGYQWRGNMDDLYYGASMSFGYAF
jgi:hypothetical protein